MEDYAQDPEAVDAAPDVIEQQTWDQTVAQDGGLTQIGAGLSAVAKPLQSTNFVENATGWRINSNGDAEFNSIKVRGAANTISIPTYLSSIDGSTTPVACMIESDGTLLKADANDTSTNEFHGFVITKNTNLPAAFLNITTDETTSFSATINAGTDRVLFVWIALITSSGSPTAPSGVTWDGNALTSVGGININTKTISIWRYSAGTSTSNQSGTLTITGTAGTGLVTGTHAAVYQYVNQSSPTGTLAVQSESGSSNSISHSTTNQTSHGLIATMSIFDDTVTLDGAFTSRATSTPGTFDTNYGDTTVTGIRSRTYTNTSSGSSSNRQIALLEIKSANTTPVDLVVLGTLRTFTGLTAGAKYYLSNTAGEVSTTPGGTSITLGKALSTTSLLIINT